MKAKSNPAAKQSGKPHAGKVAQPSPTGNFVRPLLIDEVSDTGLDVSIEADAAECAAMAKSDGLVAIASFEADFHVAKQGPTKFKVSGVLRARVAQTCVVSLDPFETDVRADIDVDFAAVAATAASHGGAGSGSESAGGRAASDAAQLDAPDPIIDGRIDLGGLAEEFLILSLDPYPRKPGVQFDEIGLSGDGAEKVSPFAVLKKLKEDS